MVKIRIVFELSYDVVVEVTADADGIILERMIEQERDPELKKALQYPDRILFCY